MISLILGIQKTTTTNLQIQRIDWQLPEMGEMDEEGQKVKEKLGVV